MKELFWKCLIIMATYKMSKDKLYLKTPRNKPQILWREKGNDCGGWCKEQKCSVKKNGAGQNVSTIVRGILIDVYLPSWSFSRVKWTWLRQWVGVFSLITMYQELLTMYYMVIYSGGEMALCAQRMLNTGCFFSLSIGKSFTQGCINVFVWMLYREQSVWCLLARVSHQIHKDHSFSSNQFG